MKLADLKLEDPPIEPTDEPAPDPLPKRKGGRSFNTYHGKRPWQHAKKEREMARPAWMADRSKLPLRPPGK
jgi:hypothetical protein